MKFVKMNREVVAGINIETLNDLQDAIYSMDLSPLEKELYWHLLDQTLYQAIEKGSNIDKDGFIYMDLTVDTLKKVLQVETNQQVTSILLHFIDKKMIEARVELNESYFDGSTIIETLYLTIPEALFNRITNKPLRYQEFEEQMYY